MHTSTNQLPAARVFFTEQLGCYPKPFCPLSSDLCHLILVNGIEPMASCVQGRRSLFQRTEDRGQRTEKTCFSVVSVIIRLQLPLSNQSTTVQIPRTLCPLSSELCHLILVEVNGIDPMASCVQGRRSPS